MGLSHYYSTEDCGVCNGRGFRVWRDAKNNVRDVEVCSICNGTGEKTNDKKYTVPLQPPSKRD